VFLTLTRSTTMFQSLALTRNQRAVAAALDQSPIMSPLVLAVLFQSKAGALQAFDALSGEIHASVQTAMIDDSQYMRQAVLGRLRSAGYAGATGGTAPLAFGGPDTTGAADGAFDRVDPAPAMAYGPMVTKAPVLKAPAPYDSDWTFWAQGVGAWGRWNTDGNAATMDRSLGGAFVGADRRFGDTWRLGFASGFTQSDLHVDARLSSADVETVHVAGYAGARFGAFDLRTGAAAAWSAIDTSRSIMFPGFLETAQANYHGATAQAFGEVGYGMAVGNVAVEPFAGAAWVHLETNAFTETGSFGGVAPLAGAVDEENVAYTTLGVRAATSYQLANGMFVIPRATVAWQHAFGDITPVAALAFQSTGVPFTVAGVPLARDAAVVDAGLDVKVTPRATLGIFYAGQLADNVQDHAVKGKFCWKF
jgi:outer membrane autotransporter protein